jgi:DUF4097 and DUF4098 domain-containing protein YvlB
MPANWCGKRACVNRFPEQSGGVLRTLLLKERMHPKLVFPVLMTGLLGLTGCNIEDLGNLQHFTRDIHYSHPLSSNGTLSVETFNGSVEVSAWDQDMVDVSGTKFGPSLQDADDLKVNIDTTGDAVSIRVVRPTSPRGNRGASFVIKVPRNAVLERITTANGPIRTSGGCGAARLKTSNGPIHVTGLAGSLSAETSNGPVELVDVDGDATVQTSNGPVHVQGLNGALDATTSNGGVRADLRSTGRAVRVETSNGSVELGLPEGFDRDVRVSTNNSGITLRLPPTVNAHVMARTINSSITTDFEARLRGQISKNQIDAKLGNGGGLLDLATSNGPIRLLKR